MNGYGERTGNCDLTQVVPDLTLKMGIRTLPDGRLDRLTAGRHHVAELVNLPLHPQAPYVGHSAFAHKAGLHVLGHRPGPTPTSTSSPSWVGNGTRFVVSEMAGRSNVT